VDDRIDGGWMRAFHFGKWEWFGSNQDLAWGPYCMETGWTNAPITAALCLYLLGESFCPLPHTMDRRAARANEAVKAEFASHGP
jgi:hypothetical protein